MGEAKRMAEAGVDTYARTARGFIIQKGAAYVERAFRENPALVQCEYLTDAVSSWLQDTSSQGFLVFIQRIDGRNIAFLAADHGALLHHALPRIFNEFHARMACCPFTPYVAPDFEAPLNEILQHQHGGTPGKQPPPAVKRLEHPDFGTLVFVDVPKSLVDQAQISGVLRVMDAMVATSDGIKKNAQRVMLAFSGYDDSASEMFERAEVRSYMRRIADNAPWWPLLAHPDTLMMWFAGLLDYTNLDKGSDGTIKVQCDPETLKQTIDDSLPMVSMLLNSTDVEESEIDVILGKVILALSAFVGGKVPDIRAGMTPAALSGQDLH